MSQAEKESFLGDNQSYILKAHLHPKLRFILALVGNNNLNDI